MDFSLTGTAGRAFVVLLLSDRVQAEPAANALRERRGGVPRGRCVEEPHLVFIVLQHL